MPYAIELPLDERADQQIRQIWAALDEQGITSVGGIPGADYHPHVTLSVFESSRAPLAELIGALRPDALLPHCTLAVGVTDKARALDVVARFRTPISAAVAGADLVEIPSGHTSFPLITVRTGASTAKQG